MLYRDMLDAIETNGAGKPLTSGSYYQVFIELSYSNPYIISEGRICAY